MAKASVKKATTTKKTVAKKVAPKEVARKTPKLTVVKDTALTKTQLLEVIAEQVDLPKKSVASVLETLATVIEHHLKKGAVGEFTLPGILKITTQKKPATKARKGINPFTGEEVMFKAKPASIKVKVRPLKKLKDMVE